VHLVGFTIEIHILIPSVMLTYRTSVRAVDDSLACLYSIALSFVHFFYISAFLLFSCRAVQRSF